MCVGEGGAGGGQKRRGWQGEELGLEGKIPVLNYSCLSSDLSPHGHLVAQGRHSSNVLITTS